MKSHTIKFFVVRDLINSFYKILNDSILYFYTFTQHIYILIYTIPARNMLEDGGWRGRPKMSEDVLIRHRGRPRTSLRTSSGTSSRTGSKRKSVNVKT